MKYIPGLNGLRALAVFIVILYHWTQNQVTTHPFLNNFIINGNLGVTIFFVISGFLISTILLLEKAKLEEGIINRKKIMTSFYVRRFLRIFPIYYLTLFLLSFSDLPGFKQNLIYYLTYTENFNIILHNSFDSFTHTWSLAVEEQFYLHVAVYNYFHQASAPPKGAIFLHFFGASLFHFSNGFHSPGFKCFYINSFLF